MNSYCAIPIVYFRMNLDVCQISDFFPSFTVIIFDEAHRYIEGPFPLDMEVFELVAIHRRLGRF